MTYTKSWTIWHHAQLRALAADGKSAKEIGLVIGKTKNSVIGMSHRKGISLTARGGQYVRHAKPEPPQTPKEVPVMEKPLNTLPPIVQNAPQTIYENPVSHSGGNVTLFERTSQQCPYIIGNVTTNSTVCGDIVAEGCVYCQAHHLACHTEPKVRQAA